VANASAVFGRNRPGRNRTPRFAALCRIQDAVKTPLRIAHPSGELTGKVAYCVLREVGYVTGVEFDPGCRWSQENYQPKHLYDPRRLE
jgi:hypothetical protein